MDFAAYIESLAKQLEGKDPTKIPRPLRGSVVLLLRDGETQHRATIVVGDRDAQALTGVHERDDRSSAVISGPLEAWVAFFHGGELARGAELQLNGDVELLETVARLISAKLSPLDLRTLRPKR